MCSPMPLPLGPMPLGSISSEEDSCQVRQAVWESMREEDKQLGAWLQDLLAVECRAFSARLEGAVAEHLACRREGASSEAGFASWSPKSLNGNCRRLSSSDGGELMPEISGPDSVKENSTLAAKTTEDTCHSAARHYKSGFMADLAVANDSAAAEAETGTYMWNLISSYHFEVACSCLILANLTVMAAEVQYNGCNLAMKLDHPDCVTTPDIGDIDLNRMFNVLAISFSSCFFLELLVRLGHHCVRDWREACNAWIFFDVFVLCVSVADCFERLGQEFSVIVNPTFMRVARVARMLRIIKMFRSKVAFQTLFLLVKSILASRHTLVWFILILYITMTCVGLLSNQLLYAFMSDSDIPEYSRREVYEYFGSYTRMLVTMFELTLGNWAPPCRSLMTHVSPWCGVLIICYRCIFCFSLVNVTMACFITETGRVANDDQILMMRKVRNDQKLAQTLREVFQEIDVSGDGLMSLEELRAACGDKVLKDLLEMIDLEVREVEELFHLMDHGEGQVRQEEFVSEVLRLRGEAKSSRQVAMMKLLKDMGAQLREVHLECRALGSRYPGSVRGVALQEKV